MKLFTTPLFLCLLFACCDVKDEIGPMNSPCNPDWVVQIIVEHIPRENYPLTIYFTKEDEYPTPYCFIEFDSLIKLEDGKWKIEDDGKHKERKYNTLWSGFYPYLAKKEGERGWHSVSKLIGKERKVSISLLDKDQKAIFENHISVRAVTYKSKNSGWTLYDAKKLEATDTTYLTDVNKGKSGNCNGITFDLNKKT